MYKYVRQYPEDREMGWSEELNGVCHDKDNWFFTQNGNLWKFPITHRIPSTCKTADVFITNEGAVTVNNVKRQIYKRSTWVYKRINAGVIQDVPVNHMHMGDIDHYNGYVFVPAYNDSGAKNCRIMVFRASDLSLVSEQYIKREDGKDFSSIGWLAINPNNGMLYTSDKHIRSYNADEYSRIQIYKIGDVTKAGALTFHSSACVYDEYGNVLDRDHMQGGCFDDNNHLHINNGYYEGLDEDLKWHSSYANSKGGISVFKVSTNPVKGGCENLYRITHSNQSSGFRYQFSGQYEEPEGITYWDLDKDRRGYATNDKKLEGQLHAIMLDNAGKGDDDFYFKHYRKNFNSKFYRVGFKTGTVDGAGTDADLYVTFYGSKGTSSEYNVGDNPSKDDLEKGNWDYYMVEVTEDVGTLTKIKVRSNNKGKNASYYLEYVNVTDIEAYRSYTFPCNNWLAKDKGDKKLYRELYVK